MKKSSPVWRLLAAIAFLPAVGVAADKKAEETPAVLNFTMEGLDGKPVDLKKYEGKVVLFVNVASRCGNTPQYAGLQQLHDKYKDQGLAVVGVPCNQFGKQEPGSSLQIAEFCSTKYGVTFDMLNKVDVNGDEACDLYKLLTSEKTGAETAGKVKWNFEKFLIGRDGKVAGRFAPKTGPQSPEVTSAIEAELKK